jgi:hypothetical protein
MGCGAASATGAAVFFGLFGSAWLTWNTVGYWLFVAAVFCLAVGLYGYID